MEYRALGQTGLKVSRLAFGTIPFKLREIPVEQGAELLVSAVEQGINFFDLAEMYGSYPHMGAALRFISRPVVVAAKSAAKDADAMDTSVKRAIEEIGVSPIDIFKLHSADTLEDLDRRLPAWETLVKAKSDGLVRAIGVSTHSCKVFEEVARRPDVDVILTILNKADVGILDGGCDKMLELVREAAGRGKGIYLMKALAGGLFFSTAEKAIEYTLSIPEVASVAVGMQRIEELIFNVSVAAGAPIPCSAEMGAKAAKRRLMIRDFCTGCGACIDECRYGALTMGEKKPIVDEEKCILCGYCGFPCPVLAIKIM